MKKKILAISLVVSLVAIAALGVTLAYFTDTAKVDNTFTLGNIDIELEELVANPGQTPQPVDEEDGGFAYDTLVPGDSVHKEPYIKNVGANDAYAMMVLEVSDAADFSQATVGKFTIDGMNYGGDFSGTLPGDTKWYLVDEETVTSGADTIYRVYLIYGRVLPASGQTIAPFTGISLSTGFDNTDLANLTSFEIDITAHAIQADNLTAQEAIDELF